MIHLDYVKSQTTNLGVMSSNLFGRAAISICYAGDHRSREILFRTAVSSSDTERAIQRRGMPLRSAVLRAVRLPLKCQGGDPQIALPEREPVALPEADELLDRLVGEPGVGRIEDRLRLHRRIDGDPLELLRRQRFDFVSDPKAVLQER